MKKQYQIPDELRYPTKVSWETFIENVLYQMEMEDPQPTDESREKRRKSIEHVFKLIGLEWHGEKYVDDLILEVLFQHEAMNDDGQTLHYFNNFRGYEDDGWTGLCDEL